MNYRDILVHTIVFGAPSGFVCTDSKYYDILSRYHITSVKGRRLYYEILDGYGLITFACHDCIGMSGAGRPGHVFGVSIVIKDTLPLNSSKTYSILDKSVNDILLHSGLFQTEKTPAGTFYRYSNSTLDVDYIRRFIKTASEKFLFVYDDILCDFPQTIKSESAHTTHYEGSCNENITTLYSQLKKGNVLCLNSEYKSEREELLEKVQTLELSCSHLRKCYDDAEAQCKIIKKENDNLTSELSENKAAKISHNVAANENIANGNQQEIISKLNIITNYIQQAKKDEDKNNTTDTFQPKETPDGERSPFGTIFYSFILLTTLLAAILCFYYYQKPL